MNTPYNQPVYISLGSYGRMPHEQAIALALTAPPEDPLLGTLSAACLQVCPQNHGRLDVATAQAWRQRYPSVSWRVHANVQVERHKRIVDWCDWPEERDWFASVAAVSHALGATAYTAHAGRRRLGMTLSAVLNAVRDAEQCFGIPVGIEGHYPTARDTWFLSSWEEYRVLLESGVRYALDLSHLHIVACQSKRIEWELVAELLANPCCIEVHLSGNDGQSDQHQPLRMNAPWWWTLLFQLNDNALMFSEGKYTTPLQPR